MFQFERPVARLMADDFRPCDIGYARIGVWVADFDRTLTRLGRLDSPPLTEPLGPDGARRACVRNPDGVYVEIMEDDPLSGARLAPSRSACPVAVRRSPSRSPISPCPRTSTAGWDWSVLARRCECLDTRRSGVLRGHTPSGACSPPVESS
jgi:hypothetical protein